MGENTQSTANRKKKAAKLNKKVGLQKGLCDLLETNGTYRAFRSDGHADKPRTLLQVLPDNVCRLALPDYVGAQLADYVQFERYEDEEITHDQCNRAVRRWGWVTKQHLIEEWPSPIGFASGDGLVFARLPFDPETPNNFEAECPIFAEILSRMTNAAAFCHRVAAIFDPQAVRKQAVWIWGPTDGGKSFLQDLLMNMVGGLRAVADLGPQDLKGAHWKAPLVGKTLIMLREAPAKFLASDEFKALTGDRHHLINPKGSPQFAVKLTSLLFCCSNSMPEIPNDDALKNRLVVCGLAAVDPRKRMDEGKLMAAAMLEAPRFLGWCMAAYEASGTKIAANDQDGVDALAEAIDEYEARLQALFDLYFKPSIGAVLVTSSRFIMLCENHTNEFVTVGRMRDFVRRKYNANIGHFARIGGRDRQRYITNIDYKITPTNLSH